MAVRLAATRRYGVGLSSSPRSRSTHWPWGWHDPRVSGGTSRPSRQRRTPTTVPPRSPARSAGTLIPGHAAGRLCAQPRHLCDLPGEAGAGRHRARGDAPLGHVAERPRAEQDDVRLRSRSAADPRPPWSRGSSTRSPRRTTGGSAPQERSRRPELFDPSGHVRPEARLQPAHGVVVIELARGPGRSRPGRTTRGRPSLRSRRSRGPTPDRSLPEQRNGRPRGSPSCRGSTLVPAQAPPNTGSRPRIRPQQLAPSSTSGDRSIGEVRSGDGEADAEMHGPVDLVGLRAPTRDRVSDLLAVFEHGPPHVGPGIAHAGAVGGLRCSVTTAPQG